MEQWQPLAAPTLVGSMPHKDRTKAIALVLGAVPEVPVWPQLSAIPSEQMTVQYLEGLPGIRPQDAPLICQTDNPGFEKELYEFYEAYLEVAEGGGDLSTSRFGLGPDTGRTFRQFLDTLKQTPSSFLAVKGQIIGPFTLLTTLKDQQERALIYHEEMQEVVVKHLSLKAKWQIEQLQAFGRPVILFLDEPALAGFGSSAYLAISEALVLKLLREVVEAVRQAGALAGIHVCANTDWQVVFTSGVEVVNFDAYNYFDKFLLYQDSLLDFLKRGHFVAWGMIPTDDPERIARTTPETLARLWLERIAPLVKPPWSLSKILSRSLFTPSCGCGSLPEASAEQVLRLTSGLSQLLRAHL